MKKNKHLFLFIFFYLFFFLIPTKSDVIFEKGKDIFLNKAMCSSCHTLADAGSKAHIGPNLNEVRPEKIRVMSVVMNGIGIMPAFEDLLSIEEIEAVAYYVTESVNR